MFVWPKFLLHLLIYRRFTMVKFIVADGAYAVERKRVRRVEEIFSRDFEKDAMMRNNKQMALLS